jgi:hypothetical protein
MKVPPATMRKSEVSMPRDGTLPKTRVALVDPLMRS